MKKLFAIVLMVMAVFSASAQWNTVKKVDPITDATKLAIRYNNPEDISEAFIVRLSDGTIEAYVIPGGYYADRNATLTIRFDKGLPLTFTCGLSGDGEALFFPYPEAIWDKVKTATERIVIRTVDYSGNVHTMIIPIEGRDVALGEHTEYLAAY